MTNGTNVDSSKQVKAVFDKSYKRMKGRHRVVQQVDDDLGVSFNENRREYVLVSDSNAIPKSPKFGRVIGIGPYVAGKAIHPVASAVTYDSPYACSARVSLVAAIHIKFKTVCRWGEGSNQPR